MEIEIEDEMSKPAEDNLIEGVVDNASKGRQQEEDYTILYGCWF